MEILRRKNEDQNGKNSSKNEFSIKRYQYLKI